MPDAPELSLIVPVFNEESSIAPFLAAVQPVVAAYTHEIIFVDDGSRDGTKAAVEAAAKTHPAIKLVSFSRNFGKEAAMAAGLSFARGRAVIPIDVDLQDPPELIALMMRRWREGASMVTPIRSDRTSDTWMKRHTSSLFYDVFNRVAEVPIVDNAGDFRLLDRRVVDVMNALPERTRFTKGLYGWAGFRNETLPYSRPARTTGETKWNYWKLWNYGLGGLISFSTAPLRIWTYFGLLIAALSFAFGLFILVSTVIFGREVPGLATVVVLITLFSGMQFVGLGLIGEYIGRLFIESKGRPLYVVDSTTNIDPP